MALMKGAAPFFYKRGKKGILLLHGFSSTPQEVKELGKFLANRNFTVYAPLLAGHGTKPEDLLHLTWQDWYDSAEAGLKKLQKETKEICIIGSSMGANLGFLLAKRHKIKKIVALAMPLHFRYNLFVKIYTSIASKFKDFQLKRYYKKDLHVVSKKVHYKVFALPRFRDLFTIMERTRQVLPKIKVPSLIMQSSTDGTLRIGNAKRIYKLLGSYDKKLVFIPDSYHVFVMDRNKHIAFKEIMDFLD